MEELLESGRLDERLPDQVEAIIEGAVTSGDASRFLRRLVNYLVIMGGSARIHQDWLFLLAGTQHPRQPGRCKKVGIGAGLFVALKDAAGMVRYSSYELTDRVLEASGLGGHLTAGSGNS